MTDPDRTATERDTPDVEGARARLARVKMQRPDVDALVTRAMRERALNSWSANLLVVFRGGHL